MNTLAVEMCEVVKKFPNPDGGEISIWTEVKGGE